MQIRFRLLPAVLFVGGLILTVRVGDLWRDISITAGSRTAAETVTDNAGSPTASEGTPPAEGLADASGTHSEAPTETEESAATEGRIDPFSYTDEEVEVLQALAKRREELEVRDRELRQREALLTAAEQRMDEKLGELKSLQATIEGLVKQHDAEEEQKYKGLVKIYENMKPKEAAQIFEELDMEVLLEVVGRMREQKAAPILAKMNPSKAKEVTLELALESQLPMPK